MRDEDISKVGGKRSDVDHVLLKTGEIILSVGV